MKVTESQIKALIKEEIDTMIDEGFFDNVTKKSWWRDMGKRRAAKKRMKAYEKEVRAKLKKRAEETPGSWSEQDIDSSDFDIPSGKMDPAQVSTMDVRTLQSEYGYTKEQAQHILNTPNLSDRLELMMKYAEEQGYR